MVEAVTENAISSEKGIKMADKVLKTKINYENIGQWFSRVSHFPYIYTWCFKRPRVDLRLFEQMKQGVSLEWNMGKPQLKQ